MKCWPLYLQVLVMPNQPKATPKYPDVGPHLMKSGPCHSLQCRAMKWILSGVSQSWRGDELIEIVQYEQTWPCPAYFVSWNVSVGLAESHCEVISQIVTLMLLKWMHDTRISFCRCISDAVACCCCLYHLELQPLEGPEDARVSALAYINHLVSFV